MSFTRREFVGAGAVAAVPSPGGRAAAPSSALPSALPPLTAQWIWFPEQRTLPCTFALFRREYELLSVPSAVPAWVTGQSRYELLINGKFVQRGPAPCDPRFWDVDPLDLAPYLKAGVNVIAAIVCIYGGGEGTWVPPSPLGSGRYGQGFLFEAPSLGWKTDAGWQSLRTRAWKPGNYQRWYLRALQEEFDLRAWPEGWLEPGFNAAAWRPAAVAATPPNQPNLTELPRGGAPPHWTLQARSIPAVIEKRVQAPRIVSRGFVEWRVPPEECFECFSAGSFTEAAGDSAVLGDGFPLRVPPANGRSAVVTFDFGRELVGHPYLTARGPAGTVIEILFVEKQEPGALLLRTHPRFGQWIRLTLRDGLNPFEAFEYDSMRWMQLAIRNHSEPVEILDAGINAKRYDWPHECDLKISDPAIQRACDASLNTHGLTAIETVVDNNIRERQQYAGDLDHPKLASYYAHGEYRQAARMFRTFTQGQNAEGWFMDCWPAWDRCQRLYQKHLGLTEWGPILDHALQLGIAAADHHLFTGDEALLQEIYPRLARFDGFLSRHLGSDGLLPVEPWTWNSVWIDHIGYRIEADKHAALNLYYAGFLSRGMARLARWSGDQQAAAGAMRRAAKLIGRVQRLYWSTERRLFIDNLPRRAAGEPLRAHARTLAMALLFDAVPRGAETPALDLLASHPTLAAPNSQTFEGGRLTLGSNYPLNDVWRFWALARFGRGAAVASDLRDRWSRFPSVLENNTYAEFYDPKPSSSGNVWCQSNPVPLIAAYQVLLGIRPLAPGFRQYEVRPQPGGLGSIEATIHAVSGSIPLRVESRPNGFAARWRNPSGLLAWFVVPPGSRIRGLPGSVPMQPGADPGTQRVLLPTGNTEKLWEFEVELPA